MKDPITPASGGSTKTTSAMLSGAAATPLQWSVPFPSLRGSQSTQVGLWFRLIGLFFVVIGMVILITGKGYLATVVGFFFTAIILHPYVPATYRVDTEGIERRLFGRRQFKPWSDFESARTNDLVLWLYPKQNLLSGRSRRVLCIPLSKQGNTSCKELQRTMPLRVRHTVADQPY
tara:strand:+ start:595 stop:1119 length:525 start_codon:yes stop_codon:yes gene_type:complete